MRLDEHVILWYLDLGVTICEHGWQVWEQKMEYVVGKGGERAWIPGSTAEQLNQHQQMFTPGLLIWEKQTPIVKATAVRISVTSSQHIVIW